MHYPIATVLGAWLLGFLMAEAVALVITKREAPFFLDLVTASAFALIAFGFVG